MKTVTKLIVVSAVALFTTSCTCLPSLSDLKPDCGEWNWPRHLTDAGKAAAENDTKEYDGPVHVHTRGNK